MENKDVTFGTKKAPKVVETSEAKTTTKYTMKEYITKGKAVKNKTEVKILANAGLKDIDADIVSYLEVKEEIKELEKVKKILEGKLDAKASENEAQKVEGLNYTYSFKLQSYDKVISKAEAIKLGIWQSEFVAKGYVGQASRKLRVVGEK